MILSKRNGILLSKVKPRKLRAAAGFYFLPETNDLPSSHTHGMETMAYKPGG